MLSAGEVSGDLQGASLARTLYRLRPSVSLFGIGGERMCQAGVDVRCDITPFSTVGPGESWRYYLPLRRARQMAFNMLDEESPNALVLIDAEGFNTALAKKAKQRGRSSLYYFPPQSWRIRGYGQVKAKMLVSIVDHLIAAFTEEYEVYRRYGGNVTYVGHPFVDTVRPSMSADEVYSRFDLKRDRLTVGLMPGSRLGEVSALLSLLIEAARRMSLKLPLQFVLPVASGLLRKAIERQMEKYKPDIKLIEGYTYEVMSCCDLIIAASGTATLEAALLGVPMVIIYRVSPPAWALGRLLLKTPYVGWPNIIARRMVVPELLQGRATAEGVADAALEILEDSTLRKRIKDDLLRTATKLGEPGALKRAAAVVMDVALSPNRRN
jgi:lipid-A-disaccharide synthase